MMDALSEDGLRHAARELGLTLDPERLHALLLEVRRLREAAAELRELPLGPAGPA